MTVKEWEEQYLNAKLGPIPVLCPTCASKRVVRVIWQNGIPGGPLKSTFDSGKAVVAGYAKPTDAPAWACLDCQPGWLTIHQLSLDDEEWQIKKEAAVAAMA